MPRVEKIHTLPDQLSEDTPRHLSKQEFARRLFGRMTTRRLIQADLARLTGLSRNNISTYIRGACYPSRRSLELLAEALECQVDDLLPNFHEKAIQDERQPDLAMKVSLADPKQAWLTVNRMVPTRVAIKILGLLDEVPVNDQPTP